MACELVKLGHRLTVVCRELDDTTHRYPDESGVTYLPVPGENRTGSTWMDLIGDLRYAWRVRDVMPKADVIVCNTFWMPVLLCGLNRSRRAVVTYNLNRFPKGRTHLWLYRHLDVVLAASTAVRDAVAGQFPRLLNRTVIVPNPIDVDAFSCKREPCSQRGTVILYTGRIHPEKGLDLLVRACASCATRFPGLCLRLMGQLQVERGGGGAAYEGLLRAQVGQGLTLEFCDAEYDRFALAEKLRDCDVYCYPSVADRGESFGVAPLEAMGVGCPVIVSGLDCFKDFVEDGRNALVFDHHADDAVERLASAIGRLLDDRPWAMSLGRAAAEDAKRFSYAEVAARYAGIFEAAVAEKQRKSSR